MIFALVALLALALGWWLGILTVSVGLRDRLAVLDAERAELNAERVELRKDQRSHYDQVVAWIAQSTPPANSRRQVLQ